MTEHSVQFWTNEIDAALKAEDAWRRRGREVVRRYRDEQTQGAGRQRFNILYANVETIRPAVYARTPRPDVRRRYRDANPAGAMAAETLERALGFYIEFSDIDDVLRRVVNDMLLPGRGVARLRYEPVLETRIRRREVMPEKTPEGEMAFPEGAVVQNGRGFVEDSLDEVVFEAVRPEYVYWEDVVIGPARKWEDVPWLAFRQRLTRKQVADRFPGFEDDLLFNATRTGTADESGENVTSAQDEGRLCEVWEIWDKESRQVIFTGKGAKEPLDVLDDPLGLQGFWPMPRPVQAITTTDTLIPVPEYTLYQELALDLERVSSRIQKLTDALRLRGIYDSTMDEIGALLQAGDNEMIPVTNFRTMEGRIENMVQYAPIREVAEVLAGLYRARENIRQTIFEVTGISDILRGATKASETATAQRIKGNFGTLRLQERQQAVQVFARDLIRLMAEVIAEKFDAGVLMAVTGLPLDSQVQAMLRNDVLRAFNVDIETDSTVAVDEAAEQENVARLLGAVVQFMSGISPFVQAPANPGGVIPMDAARDMVLAAVRKYRGVRGFEEALSRIGAAQSPQGIHPSVQPPVAMNMPVFPVSNGARG